uniref:Uncharacterized protein n=1 Tax=viral metagenome TaxID=1070528 RepID=A0A6C0KLQ3_9ZZZZ
MSLSVLKRKAGIKYNSLSSRGKNGFSLNNPRRVDSHTNKTQTQTPMKGNVPRGHGTCCGKYPVVINKSNYNNYDPHVREYKGTKSNTAISVKNYHGGISDRYRCCKEHLKPNNTLTQINSATYVNTELYLQQKKSCLYSTKSITNMNTNCNVIKDVSVPSQSEYLQIKKCLP